MQGEIITDVSAFSVPFVSRVFAPFTITSFTITFSLAFPFPAYVLAEACLLPFTSHTKLIQVSFGFPCPIPAVLNSFFVFLLDRLSVLPDLTSFLYMSELNQEHVVHVCMVFWSSTEVFFEFMWIIWNIFTFWVLHNTAVFTSKQFQGDWGIAKACSYLFQGRGLTRSVGWQHCWSVFAQRLRNTFL